MSDGFWCGSGSRDWPRVPMIRKILYTVIYNQHAVWTFVTFHPVSMWKCGYQGCTYLVFDECINASLDEKFRDLPSFEGSCDMEGCISILILLTDRTLSRYKYSSYSCMTVSGWCVQWSITILKNKTCCTIIQHVQCKNSVGGWIV